MKNNFSYKLPIWVMIASAFAVTSCNEWNEVESLKINTPTFEEQNPQLYADYLKDLNRYKSEVHKVVFISFENPAGIPGKQAERLTAVPDSVDFICLNNPEVNEVTREEMGKLREKGTRTIYSINYATIEEAWKEKVKTNPELTEEEGLQYISDATTEQLEACDKYGFDGIIADYTGRSLVSLTAPALKVYNDRQQRFLDVFANWKNRNADKVLVFYGNVQYLVPENMNILNQCDYIMLKTAASTNGDDYALKMYLAIQAGKDAVNGREGVDSPVPSDRFIVCVELPQEDDKDKVKGYWSTVDENGEKMLAAQGAARWMIQYSPDYTRKGVFIWNAHVDYHNDTYSSVREVIRIMNPNK